MAKKYKCHYCEKNCVSSTEYRKAHKASFFHRNKVLSHYQQSNPSIMWSCRHSKFFGRCLDWKACQYKYLTTTNNKTSDLNVFPRELQQEVVAIDSLKKNALIEHIPKVFLEICSISELPKSLLPLNEDVVSRQKKKREFQERLYQLHDKIKF